MKAVILDGYAVNPGDLSWDFLSEFGEYTVYDMTSPEEMKERLKNAEIVLTNRARITEDILDACPSIKYVTALGTGFDMIDVKACRERGVEVCNVPGYSTSSVAQWAFTLLLSLVTDVDGFRSIVKDGKWTGMTGVAYQSIKFSELSGKTVGVYGCGAIGTRFGEICAAFGMKVLGYRRSTVGKKLGCIEFVTKEELLAKSDIISFHCPLTDETHGLVNSEFISKMKKGAYIINTSRGAVVNENDLADALASGYLSGAAIDVMIKEPPERDNPLLYLENCIITPHCAWVAKEARLRLLDIIASNIRSFVNSGKGINRVLPPEK